MRIASLVLLVALLATLGLLACGAPAAPAVSPTPTPRTEVPAPLTLQDWGTPLPGQVWTPVPVALPPGAVPVSTITRSYTIEKRSRTLEVTLGTRETFDLKAGDKVVMKVSTPWPEGVAVSVYDPTGGEVRSPRVTPRGTLEFSFQAQKDGAYEVRLVLLPPHDAGGEFPWFWRPEVNITMQVYR